MGVSKTSCGAWLDEVRWSRSGPLGSVSVSASFQKHNKRKGRHERRLRKGIICQEARSENIPQVLLDVLPHYTPILIDEIRHIQQLVLLFLILSMALNNSSWHNADPTLFRKVLIFLKVRLPLVAQVNESGFFGQPVGEMILWKNSDLSALGGCGANKVCCSAEVVLEVQWLRGLINMWSW